MRTITDFVLGTLVLGIMAVGPISMIWGWLDWAIKPAQPGRLKFLSLAGFTLGSASVLLAAGSLAYSHSIGGFPFYDPLLMRIYATGSSLSLLALLFGIAGVWRKHLLRWRAVLIAACTLFMWFTFAMGE